MSRGRHRVEPAERALPRVPRSVAAGVGALLLGVPVGVAVWPDTAPRSSSASAALTITAPDDGRRDAAAALRTVAAFRAEERTSRGTTAAPRPAAAGTAPARTTAKPTLGKLLWVTTQVNVRSGPSAAAERIAGLAPGVQVRTTGVTAGGFSQVVTGGRTGWVRSGYLSPAKPRPKPKAVSTPAGVSGAPCPISSSIETHLASNARSVYRAVCAAFGKTVSAFGGYRAGDPGDHGSGRAVDIMVSGDPGLAVARYVQTHAGQLRVKYVIYQQKIWQAGNPFSQWKLMEDRGGRTANHYDHVHVSVL